MVTYKIDLDITPGGIPKIVHVKQYQTDATLEFKLHTRRGTLNIGNVTDCSIRGTKTDGNGISIGGSPDVIFTPSTNTVSVKLKAQMTAVAGRQPYEITVTDSTGKMITATFYLDVQRAAFDMDTLSDSVIRELVNALDHTDDILDAFDQSQYDNVPTTGSTHAVKSGGIKTYVDNSVNTLSQTVEASLDTKLDSPTSGRTGQFLRKSVVGNEWVSLVTEVDTTLTRTGIPADAKVTGNAINNIRNDVMVLPATNDYGVSGQYPRSTGNGIEWTDYGLPSDEQTAEAVRDWLDDHPEATTTVADNSITADKLTDDLRLKLLNGYVTPEMYGAKGDGITDDTVAIQTAFNNGKHIEFTAGKTYKVSKGSNTTLYPDNDAPCVWINSKNDVTVIGNGAELHVEEHGQGILEIVNCNNVVVDGLKFSGHGTFPTISNTGRGEKGEANGGYYKADYNWEAHKNNSVDTSSYTGIDGDTSAVWGTFGGGYICNIAMGVLIDNGCQNIVIRGCTAEGFNYNGFSVGFKGHSDYPYNKDILFTDCYVNNIYDTAFNMLLVDGATVENSYIENIGHPSARPVDETTPYAYTYADPGYGVACRAPYTSASRAKNVKVLNNIIKKCVRKGVDSHSVDGYVIKDNYITLCYVSGIEMAGGSIESRMSYDILVDSNTLEYCGSEGNALNQYIYTGSQSFDPDAYEVNVVISNNILRNCSCITHGIINVRIGKNTSVTNNIIAGVWSLGNVNNAVIFLGQGEKVSHNIRLSGNYISLPNSHVPYPIHAQNLSNSIISDNIVNIDSCNAVLYVYGSLASDVNIIGNNLHANTAVSPPSYTTTGKVFGNTMTGSTRGFKAISGRFTATSGAFMLADSAIKTTSTVLCTQEYLYGAPLNLVFTVQKRAGEAIIYVRDSSNTLYEGDLSASILIINNE